MGGKNEENETGKLQIADWALIGKNDDFIAYLDQQLLMDTDERVDSILSSISTASGKEIEIKLPYPLIYMDKEKEEWFMEIYNERSAKTWIECEVINYGKIEQKFNNGLDLKITIEDLFKIIDYDKDKEELSIKIKKLKLCQMLKTN